MHRRMTVATSRVHFSASVRWGAMTRMRRWQPWRSGVSAWCLRLLEDRERHRQRHEGLAHADFVGEEQDVAGSRGAVEGRQDTLRGRLLAERVASVLDPRFVAAQVEVG
jgi:hypothetical protein